MYFHKLAVSFCLSATVMVGFVPSMPGVQAQNIALNAGAIQSSTYSHGSYAQSASLAVDGNINGGSHYSVSITNEDNPSFWEVDLNGSYNISKIFVFNRVHGADRMNGFQLEVLDAGNNTQYDYTDSDDSGRNLFEIDLLQEDVGIKEGSKVRIELSNTLTTDNHLQLAEVMVFGEQENVALKGTATQSSTYDGLLASNAIDGGSVALDQTAAAKRSSMSIAAPGLDGLWWKLELDQDYIISQVIIFNRSDYNFAFGFRLRGFVLEVLDKDDQVVFTQTENGTYADVDTPLSFVIDVNPSNTVGKKVRIELPTGEHLQLQEVMVFGVVPPAVVPGDNVGQDCGAAAAADTFTVHFTTSSLPYSESSGKFYIAGYGHVPLECQEKGAKCDITICGRNTLDIVTSSLQDMWRFSITGHIGPLVDRFERPTSGSKLFPTIMGGSGFDVFQSYQLVKTDIEKWIDADPFSSWDDVIMEERLALANIYFATNGEGWVVDEWLEKTEWMRGTDHCDWDGVYCNRRPPYVMYLSLNFNEGLTGPIPEAIGNLVNLRWLSLSYNKLTGPIPEAIGNLVNLEGLYLNSNELTGPIPETISDLVNLQDLYLNDNQLTGPIPEAIDNMVSLKRLGLDGNELTGPIPVTIGNLVNLNVLYLGNNELDPTPEWLTTFCESRTTLTCYF